jgi:predicted AlkP superfamily phosphohydrolase/phosphomutase
LLQRIERKTAMAVDLMGRAAWDLYMVGFGDSHCVGHQLWHLHDERHPKHDAALRADIGDPVRDVYVALDRAVGRLLEEAGPETFVMVLCSHGMSAHYDASYLLDEVLRRLERKPAPASRRLLDEARRWWKKLPLSVTERFSGIAGAVNRMPDEADRRERKCFVVPSNANSPGIRLNLKGREPEGKIAPGDEADRFVAELTGCLLELTEPGDGRRLVKEVVRSAERFAGEHVDLLPDLFVRWNREAPITGVASPRIGTIVRADESTQRTGDHRPGGVYFVKGPGVAAGARVAPGRDEDIAPTIVEMLGGSVSGFEGRQLPVR